MKTELIIGIIMLAGGILTLIARIFKIEKMFWKLDKMKSFWGEKTGSIIHIIAYTILPIVIGTILILANINKEHKPNLPEVRLNTIIMP